MLTTRQAEAHRFIFEYTRHNGWSPTLQEIADHLGLANKSTVFWLCTCLSERGFIKWIPHMARSITVLKNPIFHNEAWFKWDDASQTLIPLESA